MSDGSAHPLRGGLTVPGGLFAGLGAGMAFGNVAAGVIGGLGLGLVLCAFVRALGKW